MSSGTPIVSLPVEIVCDDVAVEVSVVVVAVVAVLPVVVVVREMLVVGGWLVEPVVV